MKIIHTDKAPKAVGAYSQAVKANGFIFVSGQVPIDPQTGAVKKDIPIEEQTELVCKNIKAILEEGGSSFEKVVKATVLLADINDFAKVNEVYAKYFISKPARAAFQVGNLPLGVGVEIELIALDK